MKRGCLLGFVACVQVLVACGLVASSNISQMTAPELKAVSDERLCNRYVSHTPAVMAERAARDLGDCNPDHVECKGMGYQKGSELYLQCRQMLAQREAAQQAAYGRMTQQGAAILAQPPPQPTITNTNCSTFGNSLNCRSTTTP